MTKNYLKLMIEITTTEETDIVTTSGVLGKIEITEKDTWTD